MNSDANREHDDGRSDAVRRADAGAQAWRDVAHAQHSAIPDHGDFYDLAANLSGTLSSVATLTQVLAWQVRGYADGKAVYDDSRNSPHPVDPVARLVQAVRELEAVSVAVETAGRRANDFWSAIGRIGVEDAGRSDAR